MRIKCLQCGKPVSTEVPEDTIIRAWIECPECMGCAPMADGMEPDPDKLARGRGGRDCYQDHCENCAFASIGGEDKRNTPEAPDYIQPEDRDSYLAGYITEAERLYGKDWRTCEFGWSPALVIGGPAAPTIPAEAVPEDAIREATMELAELIGAKKQIPLGDIAAIIRRRLFPATAPETKGEES